MGRIKIHPEAKDIDKFFGSKRGEQLCKGTAEGVYLRNRLELAFKAGWESCKDRICDAINQSK